MNLCKIKQVIFKLHSIILITILYGCSITTSISAQEFSPIEDTVSTALNAWKEENWRLMYTTLSSIDKQATVLNEFVRKREELALAVKLKDYEVLDIVQTGNSKASVVIRLSLLKGPGTTVFPANGWTKDSTQTIWKLVDEKGTWYITFMD